MIMNWKPPEKPTDFAEKRLIEAILNGDYPIDSSLPSERDLCEQLGVTRPTLREALQRMRRDGWIEVHQGKATRVQDYFKEGNLNVLNAIANTDALISHSIVENLLEVRLLLAPTYFSLACQKQPLTMIEHLNDLIPISDDPHQIGKQDWDLHKTAALLSSNPVFLMILNGFEQVYLQMATRYFSQELARSSSQDFYRRILTGTKNGDYQAVFACTREIMQNSITYWKSSLDIEEEE